MFEFEPKIHFVYEPPVYRDNLFDSDKRLNHNSWTIGGTHITNFSLDALEVYKSAIKEYGDENLILSAYAYDLAGNDLAGYCMSLHQIVENKDLSAFWRIFDRIKQSLSV